MNLIGQQPMGQLPGQQLLHTGQQIPGVMAPVGVPVMNFGGGVDPQQQLQAMAVQNMMGLPTGMQGLVGRGRGRNMDRGNRQNNRRDSGLSREVEAIGATLNNLGNMMAAQQYSALQAQQQQQAAAAQAAAEEKQKKENEALMANVLAAANAQSEASTKALSASLKAISSNFEDLQKVFGADHDSSSSVGQKRQAPPPPVPTPRGKAKARARPGGGANAAPDPALGDPRLRMLLARRISDNEREDLLEFLEVHGVDWDSMPDLTVRSLVTELDVRDFGTRDEWAQYIDDKIGTPAVARWTRGGIILRLIANHLRA